MAASSAYLVPEPWTGKYISPVIRHTGLPRERSGFTIALITGTVLTGLFVLLPGRYIFPQHIPTLTSFLVLLPTLYLLSHHLREMATAPQPPSKPFPFLDLPAELREMVYENLIEDPHYPAKERCAKHAGAFASVFGHQWSWQAKKAPHEERKSNWILLANRQIHEEYMALLARKATFFLTVSPENYTHPKALATPEPSTPPAETVETVAPLNETPSTVAATAQDPALPSSAPTEPSPKQSPLWKIAPTTLSPVRRCSLKLITTSAMLGVTDPRTLTPGSWDLAHQVQSELRNVKNVRELNLHVKAVGDPLWNPMWVWFHAMTSFFRMGEDVDASINSNADDPSDNKGGDSGDGSGEVMKKASGPRISKILFSLDTWSPGENYLARNEEGKWGWYCIKGHRVHEEAGVDLTVRQFCHRLYFDCATCRGSEAESEAEESAAN